MTALVPSPRLVRAVPALFKSLKFDAIAKALTSDAPSVMTPVCPLTEDTASLLSITSNMADVTGSAES